MKFRFLHYWLQPIAQVLDDACAQGIEISVTQLLAELPQNANLSWKSQRRYAISLRERYNVPRLTQSERDALMAKTYFRSGENLNPPPNDVSDR